MKRNIYTLKVRVLLITTKCIICKYIPDKFVSGNGDIKRFKERTVRLELVNPKITNYHRGQEIAQLTKNYTKFPQTVRNYRIKVFVS